MSDCFAGECAYTNCVDLVKLFRIKKKGCTDETYFQSTTSYRFIFMPAFVQSFSVFSVCEKRRRRRLYGRWTESDRGGEQWRECVVKAAGQ